MQISSIRKSALAVVSAGIVAGGLGSIASFAATPDPAATPMASHQGHEGREHQGMERRGMGRPGMGDPFMMAVHQLDLTVDQKARIKGLMDAAHQQHQGMMPGDGSMFVALGNPGDPGYAAAVANAKSKVADLIQAHSDLDVQIYALLTDAQKAQLPTVLAQMQAKFQAHRAEWQNKAPAK